MNYFLDLFQLELKYSAPCETIELAFNSSIRIYINKPQVVNKWLAGSGSTSCTGNEDEKLNEVLGKYKEQTEFKEFITKYPKKFQNVKYAVVHDEDCQLYVFVPFDVQAVTTLKSCAYPYTHAFHYDKLNSCINVYLEKNLDVERLEQTKWLETILIKKLAHWCLTIKTDELMSCANLSTLTLYPNMVNDYVELYQELKGKYWDKFATNWLELTNTEPKKYIHEDISIATYLVLVWRYFDVELQKFVDLGCGNGLLVYILNDLGYNGYGIDLTKRRIWDSYEFKNSNCLIEKPIDPRTDSFPDCDWLIGNHSDELTPWLPIMANHTPSQNIFLIPCCFFSFNKKFEFKAKNQSRYDGYISYLMNIFKLAGFKVYKDKLRIPSTKNICIIGIKENNATVNQSELHKLTNKECESFQIRDVEKLQSRSLRNCTKNVDNDLKKFIVKTVLNRILSEKNEIQKFDGVNWNAGGVVGLGELAALFTKDTLNQLKQECGGIKTLLKNHHQMFEIENKDDVKLRINFLNNDCDKDSVNFKKRDCLYNLYHPNGCLFNDAKCCFKHQNESI